MDWWLILIAAGGDARVLDYATALSAILGLLIAIISIIVAVKAWKAAQENLQVAKDALAISQTEHQVFMENQNARADLVLSVEMVGGNDQHIAATAAILRWKVGLRNFGNTTATNVRINFLLPRALSKPQWTRQDGAPLPDPDLTSGPVTTTELLPLAGTDQSVPAHYLIKTVERIEPRRTHLVTWISAHFDLGPLDERVPIPIKVKAWSDELPDDQDEVVVALECSVTNGTKTVDGD